MIRDPSRCDGSQPSCWIDDLRVRLTGPLSLNRGKHGQDGFARNIFSKVLIAVDSRVDEPPQGRQEAVAQPLHRRRVLAPESLDEFGVVQNTVSPSKRPAWPQF